MNVWILNHYAGPPSTTPATRTFDLGKQLVGLGHQITVFACSFNHYSLAEEQLKPLQLFRFDELDGVRFVWIKGVPYQRNDLWRFLNMSVYAIVAFLVGLWLGPRPNIIIGVTVHPYAPVSAFLLSKVWQSRFWLDITDIWPQSLIDLRHLREDSLLASIIGKVETFSMRKAELITSVLPNIAQYVHDKGFTDKPTAYIPNGIDGARVSLISPLDILPDPSKFTVAFAGGFAPAHALEVILDAAAIIQSSRKSHIRFVLIGDGPEMGMVKGKIEDLRLINVHLAGFIPKSRLYAQLAQADGFLVTGRKLSVYRYGMSYNKIFDYLLVGRPVIFAVDSSNSPIAESGAVLEVPAEDPTALAEAIVKIDSMPLGLRQEMGRQAREFVLREFDYAVIAKRLAKLF